MAVRKYKPTSNGRRNMSVLTFDEITTDTPEKSLLAKKAKNAGRTEEKINTTMKELDRQFNKEIFEPMRDRYLSQE